MILVADLGRQQATTLEIEPETREKFIGGKGVGGLDLEDKNRRQFEPAKIATG